MARSDDEVWRSIVENFGDRARLDDDHPPAQDPDAEGPDARAGGGRDAHDVVDRDRTGDPRDLHDSGDPGDLDDLDAARDDPDRVPAGSWSPAPALDDDTFTPPVPPPLPRPRPARLIAWVGVLLTPALIVLLLAVQGYVSGALGGMLAVWFLGGFGYLVGTMPVARAEGDDGAQV